MGKRSRDLFSLLEEREQGNKAAVGSGDGRRREAAPAAGGLWADLRKFFTSQPVAGRGASGRRGGVSPAMPGVLLAGVAVVCLGVGWGLGRWLPRGEAVGPDLAARGEAGKGGAEPRRPGPLGPGAAASALGQLSPEKEVEILSNRFFVLLQFAAPQAEEAARAAAYLRAQGVDTARVRKLQTKADKADIWNVLAYVVADDVAGTRSKLAKVDASGVWKPLSGRLQAIQTENPWYLDPSGG